MTKISECDSAKGFRPQNEIISRRELYNGSSFRFNFLGVLVSDVWPYCHWDPRSST